MWRSIARERRRHEDPLAQYSANLFPGEGRAPVATSFDREDRVSSCAETGPRPSPGTVLALALQAAAPAAAQDFRARLPQDEVIYFVLPDRFANGDPANDRGGLSGDRGTTGFDPADARYYHGGDLKGLAAKLPYLQALGITAIWVAPIFVNKPVQGGPGQQSAGYHGYWITDFTHVDPHFGTDAAFKALVDAAHARGMKVYMDIVANHTADVIQYRECVGASACPYRGRADYPYQRRGGVHGAPINPGFAGDAVQTAENFAKLTDPGYAYTPFVPEAERAAKHPAWLNDPFTITIAETRPSPARARRWAISSASTI